MNNKTLATSALVIIGIQFFIGFIEGFSQTEVMGGEGSFVLNLIQMILMVWGLIRLRKTPDVTTN